jgi:hypothetical protein
MGALILKGIVAGMEDYPFRAHSNLMIWIVSALTVTALSCGSDSSPLPNSSATSASNPDLARLGPLAVIETPVGSDARGGVGPVQIDESCVTMTRENGEVLLLVWHADDVTWNQTGEEIIFSSTSIGDSSPVTIKNGDTITVGGESLRGDEPVMRELDWLATPSANCNGEQWAVSSLQKQ